MHMTQGFINTHSYRFEGRMGSALTTFFVGLCNGSFKWKRYFFVARMLFVAHLPLYDKWTISEDHFFVL